MSSMIQSSGLRSYSTDSVTPLGIDFCGASASVFTALRCLLGTEHLQLFPNISNDFLITLTARLMLDVWLQHSWSILLTAKCVLPVVATEMWRLFTIIPPRSAYNICDTTQCNQIANWCCFTVPSSSTFRTDSPEDTSIWPRSMSCFALVCLHWLYPHFHWLFPMHDVDDFTTTAATSGHVPAPSSPRASKCWII